MSSAQAVLDKISNCLFDIHALRQDNHLQLNLGEPLVFPPEQSIHQNVDVKIDAYHGDLEAMINFFDHVASVSQFCHIFVCCLIQHQRNQAIPDSACRMQRRVWSSTNQTGPLHPIADRAPLATCSCLH